MLLRVSLETFVAIGGANIFPISIRMYFLHRHFLELATSTTRWGYILNTFTSSRTTIGLHWRRIVQRIFYIILPFVRALVCGGLRYGCNCDAFAMFRNQLNTVLNLIAEDTVNTTRVDGIATYNIIVMSCVSFCSKTFVPKQFCSPDVIHT